jgi:hypothetical protein
MEKAIVELKPHNLTRSDIQSNLYFMWIDVIREVTGESKDMQHKIFAKMFLGYVKTTSRKGEVFEELRSTKTLKVAEMQEYLEQIDSLVSEYGITLPRPEEYYQAMGIKT